MKINSQQRLASLNTEGFPAFQIGFDSPEGFHTATVKAADHAHAQMLLRFLRLNGRLEGRSTEESEDKLDALTLDVPTFIRVMELSRETVQSDEELHRVVEALLHKSKEKGTDPITMDDYSDLFPDHPEPAKDSE